MKPLAFTTKQAISQGSIQRIYQPMWKAYRWTADGCGDNLYQTAGDALRAFKTWRQLGVVLNQKQLNAEAA
jgi:hypothetical protein